MGFSFRYETLLSYREHIKEQAELEYAKAKQKLIRANRELDAFNNSLQEAKASLQSMLTGRTPSEEVLAYSDYLAGLNDKINLQEEKIAGLEKEVKSKMEDLLDKTKQYKIIEKLKEKDFQEWQYQELQKEQTRLNEVTVIRHGREFY